MLQKSNKTSPMFILQFKKTFLFTNKPPHNTDLCTPKTYLSSRSTLYISISQITNKFVKKKTFFTIRTGNRIHWWHPLNTGLWTNRFSRRWLTYIIQISAWKNFHPTRQFSLVSCTWLQVCKVFFFVLSLDNAKFRYNFPG